MAVVAKFADRRAIGTELRDAPLDPVSWNRDGEACLNNYDPRLNKQNRITFVVKHCGWQHYQRSLPSSCRMGRVKREAMDKFGIEQSAAAKYGLFHRDERISDDDLAGNLAPTLNSTPNGSIILELCLIRGVPGHDGSR
jgi:hypothetical protein